MKFRKMVWIGSLILVLGAYGTVHAGSDTTDFINQANSDFQSIAQFMNGPFANSMGFFTGLGWDLTPSVYDLVAGPHFELSLGAGADFIPLPNLNNLKLPVLSAASNISLPSGVPLPFPIVTARIGLFSGLDAGFRYTYLPPLDIAGVGGHYNGWGIDLRYKILDGAQLPTVTLSTSFDTMTGTFSLSTSNIDQTGISYTDPNSHDPYNNASISGNSNYDLNWTTRSVGAKVMVGKSLGILYPFAAIGFQRNSGTITSSITGNFIADLGGAEPATPFDALGNSSSAPVVLEPKYVLGLSLGAGLGFQWGLVGESNGTDVAGSTSFALEF